MENNIVIGQNIVYAKQTVNFVDTPINQSNTLVVYLFEPDLSPSYQPGRTFNPINGFVAGKSYLLKALAEMDLTAYVSTSSINNSITTEDGTPIIPE